MAAFTTPVSGNPDELNTQLQWYAENQHFSDFKQTNPVGEVPTRLYESLERTEVCPANPPPLLSYRTREKKPTAVVVGKDTCQPRLQCTRGDSDLSHCDLVNTS